MPTAASRTCRRIVVHIGRRSSLPARRHGRTLLVHDQLNDKTFEWQPEKTKGRRYGGTQWVTVSQVDGAEEDLMVRWERPADSRPG